MPTPFANTLRSLNADRFRGSLIGLAVALVLLLAWGGWFLLARITVYEVSTTATVAEDGYVVAEFPAAAFERIRRGQAAWLRPVKEGVKQPARVPGVVFELRRASSTEPSRVKLFPVLDRDPSEVLPAGQKVKVEIEVETVPPAAMVLRTSGLLVDAPDVALSPQSNRDR
jgi:hypothetical protein